MSLSEIIRTATDARYLWLPLVLGAAFWELWLYYIRARFLSGLEWVLLEIKIPREIMKGPQAMEAVLIPFHQTKDGNFVEKYWKGFLRPWFSLEIVSIGGKIRFFVYTQKFFRNLVEAQFYAQYPDVEIAEIEDYTKFFAEDFRKEWNMQGAEFKLTAKDAYPIKTYVDYKLHEMATKEEQKTDPVTSFLECIGAIKAGEQIWFQILMRATKKDWKEEGKKLVDEIIKKKEVKDKDGNVISGMSKLTPGEQDIVKAVERDASKLGFDVGIRAIYFAKNEIFNAVNFASLVGATKQYNALNLNGFKTVNSTGVDYFKWLEPERKAKMLDAYRQRSVFYTPYPRNYFVLNTEELATIFHFPGRVAETPTLDRIEAKKSEAPTNLPI